MGSYLFKRVMSHGGDSRFEQIRAKPSRFAFAFFAQAIWVSLIMMPALAVNAIPATALAALPRVTSTDVLGIGVWASGFAYEIIADYQKSTWVNQKRNKQHDEPFMTSGLFSKR